MSRLQSALRRRLNAPSHTTGRPFTPACRVYFETIGRSVTLVRAHRLLFDAHRYPHRLHLDTALAETLVNGNIKLSDQPNEDPVFMSMWLTKLTESESRLGSWRTAHAIPPPQPNGTRDPLPGNANAILIPYMGGELELQSLMLDTVFDHANLFVSHRANFRNPSWFGAFWARANRNGAGTSDVCTYQIESRSGAVSTSDFEGDVGKAIFELKPGLTLHDLQRLLDFFVADECLPQIRGEWSRSSG